ncbi:uncharacterized protein LOC124370380 [Homalodisca vitripennis]|uniref:uncharacterized protein LOC124370380 n=2 Tax=Homalodisca vitripennis TaxID=197043 RepID=UPI001EEB13B5|nr:uncharacterized protein LOC124370380 [Homalodisca vitripennis]
MEAEHTGGILEGSEGVGIDIINAEVVIVQQENVNIMDITVETPQNVEQVELVEEMPGPLAKKRKKNERAWKKTVAKVARHRPKGFPQMPSCKHSAKSKYRCAELSLQDVRKIHQQYYKDADLQSKKNFILQHVIVSSAKRTRLPEGIKSKRNVSTDFFLT